MKIDKKDWRPDTYAEVKTFSDVIRFPVIDFEQMNSKEKDKLRQTQCSPNEVIQILGEYNEFYLMKKFESTLGWIKKSHVTLNEKIKNFPPPMKAFMTPEEFLKLWKGVIYEFGGLSLEGIDCSGFTQLFYLHVLGKILPKNSFNQRKLGTPKDLLNINDFDLVFCNPLGQMDHHVVLFYKGLYWHSRRLGGVVGQSPAEFTADFKVEEVRALSNL
jgi:probable lipoprotein NlpC